MRLVDRIIFNIVLNSACSFVAGVLVVVLGLTLFRVKSPTLRLYCWSLPFLKVIVDICNGIPPDSYLWTNLDFLSLPSSFQGFLSVVVGYSLLGPKLGLHLGVRSKGAGDLGHVAAFTASFPDVAYAWVAKHFGAQVPATLLFLISLVSGVLLARRFCSWFSFERMRGKDRQEQGESIRWVRLRNRVVDIYVTWHFHGSPFAGGLLKPFICFPRSTFLALTAHEREAVIGHELAHTRHFDLIQALFIAVLGDVFWFIPFYRMVVGKVDQAREMVADKSGTKAGVDAQTLARALLKLGEMAKHPPQAALYSALLKHKSSLSSRIEQLCQREERSVNPLKRVWSLVVACLVTGGVMSSTFVGNYEIEPHSRMSDFIDSLVEMVSPRA